MYIPKDKLMCFVLAFAFLLTTVPLPSTHGSVSNVELNTRSGKTFVVNASGGGDYTRIQWAVDNASDGDRIIVERGEYRENIEINSSIELISPCLENATINATGLSSCINFTSDDVTVKGFHIINSEKNASGIRLKDSRHCIIERNNISGNGIGISFFNSSENRVSNNTISRSDHYGVWMDNMSIDNSVYLNNFIDNHYGNVTEHAQGYDDTARNNWSDDGDTGNYWSDYETRYPNASNDGVKWDEPYCIDAHFLVSGEAYDFFPLCNPVETMNPYPLANAGPDITIRERRTAVLNGSDSMGLVPIVNYTWSFTYDNDTYSLHGELQSFRFDIPGMYEIELGIRFSYCYSVEPFKRSRGGGRFRLRRFPQDRRWDQGCERGGNG